MIYLEYFNGKKWVLANPQGFYTEQMAWLSLGGDDLNYRAVRSNGEILTSKLEEKEIKNEGR